MKKPLVAVLLSCCSAVAFPAWGQTRLTPKTAASRVDNCAPIGRTANGELVYSMKCDNIPTPPAPPAPPPQAELKEAPPPEAEAEVRRSGIFGLSYDRRQDQ